MRLAANEKLHVMVTGNPVTAPLKVRINNSTSTVMKAEGVSLPSGKAKKIDLIEVVNNDSVEHKVVVRIMAGDKPSFETIWQIPSRSTLKYTEQLSFHLCDEHQMIQLSTSTIPVSLQGEAGPEGAVGEQGERGATGRSGTNGTAMTFRGAWSPNKNYRIDDVVQDKGSSWIATAPSLGKRPFDGSSVWGLFAAKGKDGKEGENIGGGFASNGLPVGGDTAQILAKTTDSDFEADWVDAGSPGLHAVTHESGGLDEINVVGLLGLLADDQNPTAHAVDHQNGGSDEINVAGLSGVLAEDQNPTDHAPAHQNGGADEINVDGLSGLLADVQTPSLHASVHENGGGDEISVLGLSGLLADDQNPTAHATEHELGGSDAIKLDDLATPDDNTDLDSTVNEHGLLKKLSGVATEFLDGDGNFTVPAGGGGPELISKANNQFYQSDTTMNNDSDFTFNVISGRFYRLEALLLVESNGGNFKFDFDGGTASFAEFDGIWFGNTAGPGAANAAPTSNRIGDSVNDENLGSSVAYPAVVKISILLEASSTGTIIFRHAQQVSNAGNTGLFAASWMLLQEES